jgi:hypothetical protein
MSDSSKKYAITKINNQIIMPNVTGGSSKPENELFYAKYPNIFIVGKKFSGKTQAARHIIEYVLKKKDFQLILFSNTHTRDPVWLKMKKKYDGRMLSYDSLNEDDAFDLFMEYLKENNDETDRFIVCMDDFSNELKDKRVAHFVKQNRHWKCITVISSQMPLDLDPHSRGQINVWLLYPKIPYDKLEAIHKSANLNIELDEFLELYNIATMEKYNFLYIDADRSEFRLNFDKKFIINEKDIKIDKD